MEIKEMSMSEMKEELEAKIGELTAKTEKLEKDLEKTKKMKRAAAKAAAEAQEQMNDYMAEANSDRGGEARLGEENGKLKQRLAEYEEAGLDEEMLECESDPYLVAFAMFCGTHI